MDIEKTDPAVSRIAYRNAKRWAKIAQFAATQQERKEAAEHCLEQLKKMLPPALKKPAK